MAESRNLYFNLDENGAEPIDVFAPKTYDRGKDYYIDIFRLLEEDGIVTGITFYLSELSPETLPRYGDDVVLVLVSDESFRARPYFADLRGVIRTYSAWPYYGYGLPLSLAQRSGLVQHVYKVAQAAGSVVRSTLARRDLAMVKRSYRTLHTPLGSFFRFRPKVRPISERSINFAFLGSVEYASGRRRWQHALVQPPKLASRAELMEGIKRYAAKHGDSGRVRTTGDFEESIKDKDGYAQALQDCRISLCPRGSNPETYRFFESCAAGCVVICEPLPDAWFYQSAPAIIVKTWSELPRLLEQLLADPQRLQQLSSDTRDYWEKNLSERSVANKITRFVQT
jgi:glycosyltransferase involved in cell wall biosynthesis